MDHLAPFPSSLLLAALLLLLLLDLPLQGRRLLGGGALHGHVGGDRHVRVQQGVLA